MGLSWGQWSPGSERPCSGGPVCVHRPSPWPLGVDFNWGPSSGSDPGTPDGFLWLLDRFLVCLGDSMSFRFEHHQDSLCYVCGVLEHLTGQARTWAAPNLEELFCQDLEEVIRDLSGFAMARESSQLSVVTQPPVLRQWLAPFSEALALGVRFLLGLPQPLQPPPLGLALTPLPQMPWTLHMVQVGGMWPAWPRTPVVPGQTVASPGAPTRHGSPPPAPARPPVRAPRRPVGRPRTAFLRGSPGPGTPAPALRVPARPGAHLEPADPEDGGHAGRPRGPVRDLAADAAPREPAPQPGPRPAAVPVGCCRGQERAAGHRAPRERGLLQELRPGRGAAALAARRAREGPRRGDDEDEEGLGETESPGPRAVPISCSEHVSMAGPAGQDSGPGPPYPPSPGARRASSVGPWPASCRLPGALPVGGAGRVAPRALMDTRRPRRVDSPGRCPRRVIAP
ncbi:protein Bop-like isoform X2 [Choloepus didactylus]|uniref:protein Bop-like isoform X2 n=1 Tax=Choloepus didactylus TaxID=27675 RepID=UPI00189CB593|nr:protein Bop-like isoform X2 [Choloepus didactylus]